MIKRDVMKNKNSKELSIIHTLTKETEGIEKVVPLEKKKFFVSKKEMILFLDQKRKLYPRNCECHFLCWTNKSQNQIIYCRICRKGSRRGQIE